MAELDPDFLALPQDELVSSALEAMAELPGLDYGDLRVHRDRIELLHVKERALEAHQELHPCGVGVRLIVGGAWGFCGSSDCTADGVRRAVRRAAELARTLGPLQTERVELAPEPPHQATWIGPCEQDPFRVPLEEKLAFMQTVTDRLLRGGAEFADFVSQAVVESRLFVSTEGSRIRQQRTRVHPLYQAGIRDRDGSGLVETMRSGSRPAGEGWEYVRRHGFPEEAERTVELLREKLAAPPVVPGPTDLVIDPSNLWLTVHESVAHGTELDRALGYEANFAGTTFATPDRVGSLRYGSPLMHVTGDRLEPRGLASVGFDDEGVAAQRWDIIRGGVLVGYQLDRQMAHRFQQPRSNGCAFADSWAHVPLQRMPNVSLQPNPDDDVSLEQLFGEVRDGIYVVGDKSWSIDQQRYNFQFTGQRFYRIRDGRLQGQLRDVAYQSRTPDFWAGLAALGGPSTWSLQGAFNCGKGQPEQVAPVSHGVPAALFRGVNVLNTRSEAG